MRFFHDFFLTFVKILTVSKIKYQIIFSSVIFNAIFRVLRLIFDIRRPNSGYNKTSPLRFWNFCPGFCYLWRFFHIILFENKNFKYTFLEQTFLKKYNFFFHFFYFLGKYKEIRTWNLILLHYSKMFVFQGIQF